jgi:hypothetical protein
VPHIQKERRTDALVRPRMPGMRTKSSVVSFVILKRAARRCGKSHSSSVLQKAGYCSLPEFARRHHATSAMIPPID